MTFGSLFAGIGGFDLGLERAGMECKWQVEIDPFARKVLAKHWPDVKRWDDVRTFPPEPLEDWTVDLICGGFPCQDISKAGRFHGERDGIDGSRSGLWAEYARVIRLLRPRFVVVENTPALLDSGIGRVLGDLAADGFDAEWACVPAAALGACHIRDRLFVLAYSNGERLHGSGRTAFARPPRGREGATREWLGLRFDVRSMGEGSQARARLIDARLREPSAVGTSDELPRGVDRRRGLGNAVVPQVAEWIGRRILEAAS